MGKKRIMVTGGAGYIGSTLSRELLARNYKVLVIDNLMYGGNGVRPFLNHPCYEYRKGDIRDKVFMKDSMEDVDNVVHLASIVGDVPCKRNPTLSIDVNLNATRSCYLLAKEQGVKKFIFASTCSNYGVSDTSIPVTETDTLNPVSLYAETKVDAESFFINEFKKTDMVTTIFRFSSAFGLSARTRYDLLINSFTFEALRDKKMMVFAPYTWRPYIHVLDISYVIIRALEADSSLVHGQIFNAGNTNMNFQKFEVVEAIQKTLDDNVEVKLVTDTDDPRTYRVDFTKVETVLGFNVVKTIEDGISEIALAKRTGVITFEDFESNTLESISEIARKFEGR